MKNWMFTVHDSEHNNLFKKRIVEKKWPIFKRTPNRKSLREDDRIVFYKAGKDGQIFLGEAKLASEAIKIDLLLYRVKLKDIKIWKKNPNIRNLVNQLHIIRDPDLWSNYIQGGTRELTDHDFELILSKSDLTNSKMKEKSKMI